MWWQSWAAALEDVKQNSGGIRSHLCAPAEESLPSSLPSAPAVPALCSCSTSGSLSGSVHAQEAPQPEQPPWITGKGHRSSALQDTAVGSSGNHLEELKCCRRWEGEVRSLLCADVQQQVCRNLSAASRAGVADPAAVALLQGELNWEQMCGSGTSREETR